MGRLITREGLMREFEEKMLEGIKIKVKHPVELVHKSFGSVIPVSGSLLTDSDVSKLNNLVSLAKMRHITLSGKIDSGLDYIFGKNGCRGSINDRIRKGVFAGNANTMNDNWQDLFDAIRFDLTIRKEARGTVRQYIYQELQMPNATKDVRPSELFPYGIVFEEHNGEGQAVRQGANLGGQYDTIPMKIYAAGFTWTLLAALFDRTYDLSRLSDGVALAYSAKKDDLAIKPILDASYGANDSDPKWTAASSIGSLRQEHLYNTLMNMVDDLAERIDPITKRKINAEGLVILASTKDARHIDHVLSGLPTDIPEKYAYSKLNAVSRVIGYDGEVIDMPDETITYGGATTGTIYMIKPNRYFKIPIKRNLIAELDSVPNVQTLAMEQRAWYFVEAMFNDIGIANFVQKATLPTW
jgi:hypothetical protein